MSNNQQTSNTSVAQTSQQMPQQQAAPMTKPQLLKTMIDSDDLRKRFVKVLGDNAQGFIVSILQVVQGNKSFDDVDPSSIINAAMVAATLKLPINSNLQLAYIIPYSGKAQFQISWRGFVQLAQRSGQFKSINVQDVRLGEYKRIDMITGDVIIERHHNEAERTSLPLVGYIGYFKLMNGFEKTIYRTVDELSAHGKKYSKTYNRQDSKWHTDFEAMCAKTVIKELLSKWAPLSIEMERAVQSDQSVVVADGKYEYPDNPQPNFIEGSAHQSIAQGAVSSLEGQFRDTGHTYSDIQHTSSEYVPQDQTTAEQEAEAEKKRKIQEAEDKLVESVIKRSQSAAASGKK